jgi:hypothetical protein
MVEWLAGNRIKGTSTERTAGTPAVPAVITQGGWKEVARTTLGSSASQIDVSSIPDKRYYMVLTHILDSGQEEVRYRLGSSGSIDTGSSYTFRRWGDGSESTSYSTSSLLMTTDQADDDKFHVAYISNLSGKEKLTQHFYAERGDGYSASNTPRSGYGVGKWTGTDPLDTLRVYGNQSGSYSSGSEVIVLGWDPDDIHTDNFFEQLASVEGDGTSTTISSGTITAKKYLWVQAFTNASSQNTGFQFNNDTAGNYAIRRSTNGGSETPETSIGYIEGSDTSKAFTNMFIINNSASAKLTLGHSVHNPTATAGTAPTRNEVVGKWANNSAQITEIDYMQQTTSVNFPSGSFIKVWGSN